MKTVAGLIALLVFATPSFARPVTDAEVRSSIIRESLAGYPGPCPCPYISMRNGRACGGRSAYSRPGGYSPICYDRDINQEMIKQYRRGHGS
jgi:hypothetical protein